MRRKDFLPLPVPGERKGVRESVAVPNDYSQRWIDTFLLTQDPAQTAREVGFLARQLPLPRFGRVLDFCCGAARHAAGLLRLGYEITGIDRDAQLIAVARTDCPTSKFLVMDVRDMPRLGRLRFDAAICMWQSFGYFDSAANDAFLRDVADLLTPGGRLILDIYHRGFFETRQENRPLDRGGMKVTETKRVRDGRLRVELRYEQGPADEFEWELFTPDDLANRALNCGLRMLSAVADFDEASPASADVPRMQIVLQKAE